MGPSAEPPAAVEDGRALEGAKARDGGPRRSTLMQERSRRTRRQLVEAALRLWTERGFDTGVEDTTVEEIAHAAGVTKGTFYFHFAHKEDILLEFGYETSQAMFKEASAALASNEPVDAVLDRLLDSLARRISESPRAAVARTLREFSRRPHAAEDADEGHFGFDRSFSLVFFHAQQAGQLPANTDARVLGETLSSVTIAAMNAWISGREPDLSAAMHRRCHLLVAGVRALGDLPEYPARAAGAY